jgi:hypothetical protein
VIPSLLSGTLLLKGILRGDFMMEEAPKVTLASVDSRSGFVLLKRKKSDLTSKKITKEQVSVVDEKPEELKKRKADMVNPFFLSLRC